MFPPKAQMSGGKGGDWVKGASVAGTCKREVGGNKCLTLPHIFFAKQIFLVDGRASESGHKNTGKKLKKTTEITQGSNIPRLGRGGWGGGRWS